VLPEVAFENKVFLVVSNSLQFVLMRLETAIVGIISVLAVWYHRLKRVSRQLEWLT
jgi:hypothetical protein